MKRKKNSLYCFAVAGLFFALSAMSASRFPDKLSDAEIEKRIAIGRDLGLKLTNNIPLWVSQSGSTDRVVRLKALECIMLCAFADKARLLRENVGDQIVKLYGAETVDEAKCAEIVVLDMLDHPELPRILNELEQSPSKLMRDLPQIVREKRYIDVMVVSNPVLNKTSTGSVSNVIKNKAVRDSDPNASVISGGERDKSIAPCSANLDVSAKTKPSGKKNVILPVAILLFLCALFLIFRSRR